jgi:hypothetical protein
MAEEDGQVGLEEFCPGRPRFSSAATAERYKIISAGRGEDAVSRSATQNGQSRYMVGFAVRGLFVLESVVEGTADLDRGPQGAKERGVTLRRFIC